MRRAWPRCSKHVWASGRALASWPCAPCSSASSWPSETTVPAQLVRVHRALLAPRRRATRERLGVQVALEGRSPRTDLSPGGVHLRPRGRRAGQRRTRRRALRFVAPGPRRPRRGVGARTIYKEASRALAIDWSDQETFARPPERTDGSGADPEASWGHRNAGLAKEDLFFGYYLSAAVMVREEGAGRRPRAGAAHAGEQLSTRSGAAFRRKPRGAVRLGRGARRRAGRLGLRPSPSRALRTAPAPGRGRPRHGPAPP